jgi:hypothetical protein
MKKIICILCFLALFIACKTQSSKKYYLNSNQLKEERVYDHRGDTTSYSFASYYSNGQLLSKGHIKDGKRNGLWEEWYADETLKWEGSYEDNQTLKLPIKDFKIILKGPILKSNNTSYLRVKATGVNPDDAIIGCTNGVIKRSDNRGLYDFMVTPKHVGGIKFFLYIVKNQTFVPIAQDSLLVSE